MLGAKAIRRSRGSATRSASIMPASISVSSPEGDLLLFEANATMVIAMPNDDERWAYRRSAIDGAVEATVAMLKRKAANGHR